MVLESGVLSDAGDHYELKGDLTSLTIPTSLQDSLNARLAQFTHGKEVAQVAAAIDREFTYALLEAVWPRDELSLQEGLDELVAAEFLYQRGVPPHSSYVFKHALIQDAALESLLRSRRQLIHRRIATVLEALHLHRLEGRSPPTDFTIEIEGLSEFVETTPERIAHHFSKAGEAESAVDWWIRAGMRGLERSAGREVEEHMNRAGRLLRTLEPSPENKDRELTIQTMLGAALTGVRGYAAAEVEAAFTRALELAREGGEHPKIFQAELGLWMFHVVRADFPRALERADGMMRLAEEHGDRSYFVEASFAKGCTALFMGNPREALAFLEAGVQQDGPDRDRSISQRSGQDAGSCSLVYMGMAHWMLGNPKKALDYAERAQQLAMQIQHPYSQVYARHFTSWIELWMRDYARAGDTSRSVVAMSEEMGFFWWTLGSVVLGASQVAGGDVDEGLATMQSGLGAYRAPGARLSETLQLAIVADALFAAGLGDESLAAVREGLEAVRETDERFWEPDLRRLEGVILSGGDAQAAEAAFREAIELALAQQAPGHHLRAALSFAEFLSAGGRAEEADQVLRPAVDSVAAEVEVADLAAARALLAGLADLSGAPEHSG
jgi:tetratricopeptide (TPR) repeat protein